MRSTTDLLDLDLVFTQQPLLTVSEFEGQCERRGVRLWSGGAQLEALHRARALVPLYRVAKDVRGRLAQARRTLGPDSSPEFALLYAGARPAELQAARQAGLLHDPRTEPFRPWGRYQRRFPAGRFWTSEFLYSPYQLLLLPEVEPTIQRLRVRRIESGTYRFHLPKGMRGSPPITRHASANDQLVGVLTALETMYRPLIVGRLATPLPLDDPNDAWWERYRQSFDPVGLLEWLGWDAERVRTSATSLALHASFLDPLEGWGDLIRHIRPSKWAQLRGDALMALDHRIAAEMLWQYYEDLTLAGAAPPFQPPERQRLRADPAQLDAVLMDFGISPHPSLVLVLEGATEMALAPRVMDLLGVPRWPSFIQLVEARGVESRLDLLATYVATPQLGQQIMDGVLLTRPPTQFLVAFDPEHKYATKEERDDVREQWVNRLIEQLSEEYRTPVMREQLRQLVQVDTWGEWPFEYAHFTDEEIAHAVLASYQGDDAPTLERLTEQVSKRRQGRANLEQLWQRWGGVRPSKVSVAKALWPTLEDKIKRAIAAGRPDDVPIARVVLRARDLAAGALRSDVMLRR